MKKGFSIIELLLYIGLLSVILTVLVTIFFTLLDSQQDIESVSNISQDANFILSRISNDIRSAQAIVAPSADGLTHQTLQLTVNGINYSYSLNNGVLQLTNDQGTNALNSYNTTVSNLTFKRFSDTKNKDSIQVRFTITSNIQNQAGIESKTYEIAAGLR